MPPPPTHTHTHTSNSRLNVLVAGCGTGKQAINCAITYSNSYVTAIDLSLKSLAYGKRMAEELDVKNVAFIQGDILNLQRLGERFNVIECSGVLHHMENPVEGWTILTNLLYEDGWMNVGLYSQIARQSITLAREYLIQKGYKGTLGDIRNSRLDLIHNPEDERIKSIVNWQDFYSTSTCRDLLFHVHEVYFDLLQIEQILEELKMEFMGFNISSSIKNAYRKKFPADEKMTSLQNWHQFEMQNPNTFATMYQFWIRKKIED